MEVRGRSGFTVVQTLTALSLSVLVLGAFLTAFFGMRNSLFAQDSYFTSNRTGYYAINVLSKDVREAIAIESSYGSDTTGTSVLILRLPSISALEIPTDITSQYDYVTYKLSGTNLTRTLDVLGGTSNRNGGSDISGKIIARNITAFTLSTSSGTAFSSLSSSQIEALSFFNVALTSSETIAGRARTMVADSNMKLMNYGT